MNKRTSHEQRNVAKEVFEVNKSINFCHALHTLTFDFELFPPNAIKIEIRQTLHVQTTF